MARKRKEKEKVDPFERARLKKLRAQQRREERKKRRLEAGDDGRRSRTAEPKFVGIETDPDQVAVKDPHDWIKRSIAQAYAWRIVNLYGTHQLPYWLSIDFDGGNPPTSGYFPCHMYRGKKDGRFYYGFLFRQCRDAVFEKWQHEHDARKELTPDR
jgi:hypothetical protein